MPTAPLESASGRRCVRSASVQNVGKLSAFRWEYQMCRSPSSVLLQPTGRKTDVSKLGQPKSRRFAEKTRSIELRLKEARLPRMKTLKEFDFAQSPHIPASRIRTLAEGGYLQRSEPVL